MGRGCEALVESRSCGQTLILYTRALCRLVIETLDPLPKDRKCFRMVNGVLVERTIEDVLPALKTNSDGLKQVLEELLKQYKLKQNELDNWKVRLLLLFPQGLDDMVILWKNRINHDGLQKKNNIQVVQP